MTNLDYAALALFCLSWFSFGLLTSGRISLPRPSLTKVMAVRRRMWIFNALKRDLRMIDTQIMAGLQNGTAFFASTSIIAIGGCFAMLGATDRVDAVLRDLPFIGAGGRAAFEFKVCGLIAVLGYAFFKFGWSYRLFNYCTILFGCLPMAEEARRNPVSAKRDAETVVAINIIAGLNFNAGLRAIFMSIGYLGWFLNAYMFMLTTVFIFVVLVHRQFFSNARLAVMPQIGPDEVEIAPEDHEKDRIQSSPNQTSTLM
ncbi:putative membrane protein [Agrobacterium vitis]|nr:putative membrane protein [Agrobacterium vitis]MBE1438769.1 putative membrane protein [Agrobacterium vitis]